MRYLVTAGEMKLYDRNTIEKIGIPSMVLMERAALAACQTVMDYLAADPGREKCALVMAGMGNNGGDGLALARLLTERDIQVEVWCVGEEEKASEQWKRQREILASYPVRFSTGPEHKEYTIIIDALFGVGLSRPVTGVFGDALERYRLLTGHRIALDMPSGIDSDTGRIWGKAARADETVTFGFCKRGLVLYPGCEWAGKVRVADIGISERSFLGVSPGMFACDEAPSALLPPRCRSGNKSTFGKVVLVAGRKNMAGAAVLSASAAYRIGAGLVKVITWEENREILQTAVPEALFGTCGDLPESLKWADVIAIGPGLGGDKTARDLLEQALEEGKKPLIIDADGLNLLALDEGLQRRLAAQGRDGREIVLTPHVGEMSRLTGKAIETLKEDLAGECVELAEKLCVTVAAKDARTFIGKAGEPVCVNLSGNSGMATGGSGDVLTGIIAGLMAQGMNGYNGSVTGVYLHGLAGDAASAQLGEHGCMAGDIVRYLGRDRNGL